MSQSDAIQLFVCYEADQAVCAERLDSWPHANADIDAYVAREGVRPGSPEAEPFKARLREQIAGAGVLVCIISQTTFLNEWINWEIETARAQPARRGMVGILLHEFDTPPPSMLNAGSIFVPFKRDAVEQGIAWAAAQKNPVDDFMIEKD